MYVHVFVCTHALGARRQLCTCTRRSEGISVFLHHFPHFWDCTSHWLAGQRAQGPTWVCIRSTGITGTWHRSLLFMSPGDRNSGLCAYTSKPSTRRPPSQLCSRLLNSHLKDTPRAGEAARRWRVLAGQGQGLEFDLTWEAEHGQTDTPINPALWPEEKGGSLGLRATRLAETANSRFKDPVSKDKGLKW